MLGAAKHSELSCLHNKVFDLTSFAVTPEQAGRSRAVQGERGSMKSVLRGCQEAGCKQQSPAGDLQNEQFMPHSFRVFS